MAVSWRRLRPVALGLIAVGVVAAVAFPGPALRLAQLPLLALFSVSRMAAAYLLALLFAIAYGATAATNRRAAVVMLPLLDVLQSVPILGFFPAALVFFVSAFGGSPVGLEAAVVFLIFTSMAWNMAFGVYESLTTIPQNLEDAADAFGLKDRLRFRRLTFPAMVPRLVYNSMLSWSNGWFFLVASEVFTAFGATFSRPGLGAYIADAGIRGDAIAIAVGIATLAAVVLAIDASVWRPLSLAAERFRIEPKGTVPLHLQHVRERLAWLPRVPPVRLWFARNARPALVAYAHASEKVGAAQARHPLLLRRVRQVDLLMFLIVFAVVVGAGLVGLAGLFLHPLPSLAQDLPAAAFLSFSRLAIAYIAALAWTIPLAAWVGGSERAARFVRPALEVFASVPATALLPVVVAFSLAIATSAGPAAEVAAILVALFSMQWYLVFNLIDGVRSLPDDLREAARAFGVRGFTYWRRVLLPAIMPSLVTGSITAWGAGWNALIVSEYIRFGPRLYTVRGIGSIMDTATFAQPPDNELLLLTILTMIVVVLAMNKLIWRPLYRRVMARYRLEAA